MSNQQLVNSLRAKVPLKMPELVEAFLSVDRIRFVPERYRDNAYHDGPFPIDHGQTISQPYTVAFMLELLKPQKGHSVLDIGSGSGWTTALLAHVVGRNGRVRGVERIPELVTLGQKNLAAFNFRYASIEQSGELLGTPGEVYDRILVSAAAEELPDTLCEQLKPRGILVMPVGKYILKVSKDSQGQIEVERHGRFSFVPLVY
jgi:protein-L-isoaspartate(D-aspartate) O-methyltransferase